MRPPAPFFMEKLIFEKRVGWIRPCPSPLGLKKWQPLSSLINHWLTIEFQKILWSTLVRIFEKYPSFNQWEQSINSKWTINGLKTLDFSTSIHIFTWSIRKRLSFSSRQWNHNFSHWENVCLLRFKRWYIIKRAMNQMIQYKWYTQTKILQFVFLRNSSE